WRRCRRRYACSWNWPRCGERRPSNLPEPWAVHLRGKGSSRMPESIDDPLLGRLEWEDKLYWWVGEIDLRPSHRIEIFIVSDLKEGSEAEVRAKAHQGLERLRQRELDYREWTANHLIDRRWNKDEPMTVQDLVELLEVASITCYPDGSATI